MYNIEFQQLSCNETRLNILYNDGKSSQLVVETHDNFIEFSLVSASEDCRRIRMFGPVFEEANAFNVSAQSRPQCLALGNGKYACIVSADVETRVRIDQSSVKMIRAISYGSVAAAGDNFVRKSRFAFFICSQDELLDTLDEVEDYFVIRGGVDLKRNDKNDLDYLFLIGRYETNTQYLATAQNIIDICKSTGLGAVLLSCNTWCDWDNQTAPWTLRYGDEASVISSLQAENIEVGLHAFVHKVADDGYCSRQYSNEVETTGSTWNKNYDFAYDFANRGPGDTKPLYEIVAEDFADKAEDLGATWFYLDAAETLSGVGISSDDWYLKSLITKTVFDKLNEADITPTTFQQSSFGANCFHYVSRSGQIDYWEDTGNYLTSAIWENPIDGMDIMAEQVPTKNILGVNHDVGWFGNVHMAVEPEDQEDDYDIEDRRATLDEWAHLCGTSLATDAPIGIRTTYHNWITDPNREKIEAAVKATSKGRLNPNYPDCNSNGIDDNLEVAQGSASDINTNGVPDECEVIFDSIIAGSYSSGITSVTFDFAGTVDPPIGNITIQRADSYSGNFTAYNTSTITCSSSDDDITCQMSPALPADYVYRFDLKESAIGYVTADIFAEDCNTNGIVDEVEVENGTCTDINSNSIPDDCEDCNDNGIPDDYEISHGTSTDGNNDGIPDECQTAWPTIISAVSLKTHSGQAGDFDYGISAGGVECRSGGMAKIVLTYDIGIYSADGNDFIYSDFSITGPDGPTVDDVDLSPGKDVITVSICDANYNGQYTLSFTGENIAGVQQAYEYCWVLLLGDVSGDGNVDIDDHDQLGYCDTQTAQDNNGACAREDIDLDNYVEGHSTADDYEIVSSHYSASTMSLCD